MAASIYRQFLLGAMLCGMAPEVFSQAPSPLESMRQLASRGDAEAQHSLGTELREGTAGKTDSAEAAIWFRKAANQGHPCACYDLGMCYAMGLGVPQDAKIAVEWFQKAAEKNHPEALMNMGIAFHEGMGVSKDLSKATVFFQRAAMAGHAGAMLNLGIAYSNGEGVQRDRGEGFQWFARAEAAGEPKAREWISILQKQGFGHPGVENGTGLIHGSNHSYFVQAPKGWVLDNTIWADKGIFAVFYQATKSIQESPILGYTRVQEKAPGGIEAHIKADMLHSLKGSTTAKLQKWPSIKTQDGRDAIIYSLQGVAGQNPEWMAYIDAPTVVILVSVSVAEEKYLSEGRALLDGVVGSIGWLTDEVHYNKK